MIEHCISSLKLNNELKTYRIYVTDALMAIADNTTHLVGVEGVVDYGRTIQKRWYDIITATPKKEEQEDNRTAEEIAADIWKNIRGSANE